MARIYKNIFFALIFCVLISPLEAQVTGNIQLTNNGVAPVPIFALGSPAVLSTTTIRKGKFYFNPEFNLGLDAKPWTIFSRVGYFLIENNKLTVGLAANLNWFFMQNKPIVNNEEFQVQRYYSFEFNGEYRPKTNQKFNFSYWRSDHLDKLGFMYENFLNFSYAFENISLNQNYLLNFKPSVFYLEDYGWVKGVFASQTTSFQRKKWKYNFFVTTSAPVTNMPGTEFIWNTGINIPF